MERTLGILYGPAMDDPKDQPETAAEDDPAEYQWPVPWHAYVPAGGLAAVMTLAWILHIASGGMLAWGVSGAALARGRFETIPLHMFAHAGLLHLFMNCAVLVEIGALVVARLGAWPLAWLRFLVLFGLSGLAGMSVYLVLHPHGQVPMLGASGAIYGLLGLLLRLSRTGEGLMPIWSPRMRRAAIDLIKNNLLWIVLLTVPAWLAHEPGGLAWEAHLGGFLCGVFLAPALLFRSSETAPLPSSRP